MLFLHFVGEAAASTGVWPPKDKDGAAAATALAKRKALPSWLRDELDRLEKQKKKQDTARDGSFIVFGVIVLG